MTNTEDLTLELVVAMHKASRKVQKQCIKENRTAFPDEVRDGIMDDEKVWEAVEKFAEHDIDMRGTQIAEECDREAREHSMLPSKAHLQ